LTKLQNKSNNISVAGHATVFNGFIVKKQGGNQTWGKSTSRKISVRYVYKQD
jgi:hypothetical protein